MKTKRNPLIALYGINNTGKSTQARRLEVRIRQEVGVCRLLKYPLYDLAPFGPEINDYLRSGNPWNLSSREFQILQVANRTQFAPTLSQTLKGMPVVAEDYFGTGIAWGIAAGVERELLERLNSHLTQPDLSILLDGRRFTEGREAEHMHESDDELVKKSRQAHLELACDYGWHVVNANQSREEVHSAIWKKVQELF